jgi:Cu-Zn family superoxide dismutase
VKKQIRFLLFLGALSVSAAAQADTGVLMNLVDENGVGKEIGQVTISETVYGLVFNPAVTGLPPGLHGFHVHENASCEPKEKDGKKCPR